MCNAWKWLIVDRNEWKFGTRGLGNCIYVRYFSCPIFEFNFGPFGALPKLPMWRLSKGCCSPSPIGLSILRGIDISRSIDSYWATSPPVFNKFQPNVMEIMPRNAIRSPETNPMKATAMTKLKCMAQVGQLKNPGWAKKVHWRASEQSRKLYLNIING